jgi:hypothetical protein
MLSPTVKKRKDAQIANKGLDKRSEMTFGLFFFEEVVEEGLLAFLLLGGEDVDFLLLGMKTIFYKFIFDEFLINLKLTYIRYHEIIHAVNVWFR